MREQNRDGEKGGKCASVCDCWRADLETKHTGAARTTVGPDAQTGNTLTGNYIVIKTSFCLLFRLFVVWNIFCKHYSLSNQQSVMLFFLQVQLNSS